MMATNSKYKTFGQRLFAGIIDGLVFIPLSIVDEVFRETEDKWTIIGLDLAYIFCFMLYCVIGNGKYGQTLGKKVMKIKVFSLDEKNLIGYKRAFFRESVWFLTSLAAMTWLFVAIGNSNSISAELKREYEDIMLIISLAWLLIELVTMFSNNKRRAVHDFLAGSVVIDLQKAERKI